MIVIPPEEITPGKIVNSTVYSQANGQTYWTPGQSWTGGTYCAYNGINYQALSSFSTPPANQYVPDTPQGSAYWKSDIEWNPATDYCIGSRVSRITGSISHEYVCIYANGGTGNWFYFLSSTPPESDTVHWKYVGSSHLSWVTGTLYPLGSRVNYYSRTYFCIVPVSVATQNIPPDLNPDNWELCGYWEQEYKVGDSYVIGDIRTSNTGIYECIATDTSSSVSPYANSKWSFLAPKNKYALFDNYRNTQTYAYKGTLMWVKPKYRVNSIGLIGLEGATSARILALSTPGYAATVLDVTVSLTERNTSGWNSYFFGTNNGLSTAYIPINPSMAGGSVEYLVQVQGDNLVKVGGIVLGYSTFIGSAQVQPVSDTLNFSKIDRDSYGNVTLVPRRNVPKITQRTFLENKYVNSVRLVRDQLNAVPALWVSIPDDTTHPWFDTLCVFGIYRTFSINLDNPIASSVNLELEEM